MATKKETDCRVCARLTKKNGAPTKCKRHGGAATAAAGGKASRTRTRRETPAGDLKDNGAKAAAKTLLGHLVRVRENLDRRIRGVEELVEVL